jgi:HSP20 family protein
MNMSDTMVAERQEKRQEQGRREQPRQEAPTMMPRVDVLEDEAGITLLADLPGVSRESLEIHVEGDSLMIEGGVAAATPEAMEAAYAEVRVPRYRRSFTLSRELDGGRIEAQLKDGVLRLRIPKQEHAQPRRVSIKVA